MRILKESDHMILVKPSTLTFPQVGRKNEVGRRNYKSHTRTSVHQLLSSESATESHNPPFLFLRQWHARTSSLSLPSPLWTIVHPCFRREARALLSCFLRHPKIIAEH